MADVFEKGKLYQLPIGDIKPDPDQPRKYLDPQALEELAASIKQLGILQPVLFRPTETGQITLVAGERRFAAAKKAGLLSIPGLYVDSSPAEIALVENLQRQDLTAIEEAEALGRLVDNMKYTHEQAAGVIGKSRQAVTDILTLNNLPQEIRDDCRNNPKCLRQILIEIARKKQARGMLSAWAKYKERQAKAAATRKRKTTGTPEELIDWVTKANTKLNAIDTAAWTDEEKTAFTGVLEDLRETIGGLLAGLEIRGQNFS